MKKAIRQKMKELREKMDEICPDGKCLHDLHNDSKVNEFYKYQYAFVTLEQLLGDKK